ncbi:MAG: universal stress protein [Planctomycetota bacterium]
MKVLIPLDGSRLADGILAHLGRVLLSKAAQLQLLCVLPEYASDDEEAAARRHLAEAAAGLAARGEQAETQLVRGADPAETILELAEREGYDLIAMATHGRSGISRLVRGSVAERVLRHAELPIYVANPAGLTGISPQGHTFQRVLVPLDGSKTAAAILPLLIPILEASQAEVILMHIDSPEAESTHPVPEVATHRAQERAEAALAEVQGQLQAAGLTCHVVGGYGAPAEQILDAVNQRDVDLLAMTSHGRTGLSRWRFGSVAEKVLRECRCPILLKRAGRR